MQNKGESLPSSVCLVVSWAPGLVTHAFIYISGNSQCLDIKSPAEPQPIETLLPLPTWDHVSCGSRNREGEGEGMASLFLRWEIAIRPDPLYWPPCTSLAAVAGTSDANSFNALLKHFFQKCLLLGEAFFPRDWLGTFSPRRTHLTPSIAPAVSPCPGTDKAAHARIPIV